MLVLAAAGGSRKLHAAVVLDHLAAGERRRRRDAVVGVPARTAFPTAVGSCAARPSGVRGPPLPLLVGAVSAIGMATAAAIEPPLLNIGGRWGWIFWRRSI